MPSTPLSLPWTPPPLPPTISRTLIPTPTGPLELLSTQQPPSPTHPPILFAHGGFGCAQLWLAYMLFLACHGIPCYAISYRGHGHSWKVGYLRMVYGTGLEDVAADLVSAVRYVEERHGEGGGVVLVGHSAGGALSQFVVGKGDVRVKGLGLVGAIPGSGATPVFGNWVRLDPWCLLRMLWYAGHPRFLVCNTFLVKQAFFGSTTPWEKVEGLEVLLAPYESLKWPAQMLRPFVDGRGVIRNTTGWENAGASSNRQSERMFVMGGTEDKLTTTQMLGELAEMYRRYLGELVKNKKIEVSGLGGDGVRFELVEGAGHQLQNDGTWEEGARKLLEWYKQL